MWNTLKGLIARRDAASSDGVGKFYVYRVHSPDGIWDVVSLLPHDIAFSSGLATEVIVGRCTQRFESTGSITEATFQPNPLFVDLLHDVIATEAPALPTLRAEAHRQHTGWVYVIDARTPTPSGEVPPHDIIGAFEVRDGFPRSYQPNAKHRLLSSNGWFKLDPALHIKLMERLRARAAISPDPKTRP